MYIYIYIYIHIYIYTHLQPIFIPKPQSFHQKTLQIAALNLMVGEVVAVPFGTRGTVLGPGPEGRIEVRRRDAVEPAGRRKTMM